jgi:hypothetical protein
MRKMSKYDLLVEQILRNNPNLTQDQLDEITRKDLASLAAAGLLTLPIAPSAYGKPHRLHTPHTQITKAANMNQQIDVTKLTQIFPKDKFTSDQAITETDIIHKVAQKYKLNPQQEVFLFTIRRIENGGKGSGLEFGCGDPGKVIRSKERAAFEQHPDLIAARTSLQNKWLELGITDSSDPKLNQPDVQSLFTAYNSLRTKYGLTIMKNNDPRRWEGNYLKSLELQARVAAGTIVKHSDANGNFNLKGFAKSWCPANPQWANLATSIINRFKA